MNLNELEAEVASLPKVEVICDPCRMLGPIPERLHAFPPERPRTSMFRQALNGRIDKQHPILVSDEETGTIQWMIRDHSGVLVPCENVMDRHRPDKVLSALAKNPSSHLGAVESGG